MSWVDLWIYWLQQEILKENQRLIGLTIWNPTKLGKYDFVWKFRNTVWEKDSAKEIMTFYLNRAPSF